MARSRRRFLLMSAAGVGDLGVSDEFSIRNEA